MSTKDTNTSAKTTEPAQAQEQKPESAAELLERAAATLERRRAPRSPKHYQLLAAEVRALIPRTE